MMHHSLKVSHNTTYVIVEELEANWLWVHNYFFFDWFMNSFFFCCVVTAVTELCHLLLLLCFFGCVFFPTQTTKEKQSFNMNHFLTSHYFPITIRQLKHTAKHTLLHIHLLYSYFVTYPSDNWRCSSSQRKKQMPMTQPNHSLHFSPKNIPMRRPNTPSHSLLSKLFVIMQFLSMEVQVNLDFITSCDTTTTWAASPNDYRGMKVKLSLVSHGWILFNPANEFKPEVYITIGRVFYGTLPL